MINVTRKEFGVIEGVQCYGGKKIDQGKKYEENWR